MSKGRDGNSSLIWDMLAVLPGWLLLLLVDPWSATVCGIPAGALLITMRRLWWCDSWIMGRLAIALLELVVVPLVAAAAAFKSLGAVSGMIVGAALLALIEWWNRRSGRSLIVRFPFVATVVFLILSFALNAILLERNAVRYPTEEFTKAISTPPDPPGWSGVAKSQAVKAVRSVINRDVITDSRASSLYRELSKEMEELVDSPAGRGIFVTLYERSGFRERGFCRGGADALEDLICAAANVVRKRPRQPRSNKTRPRLWNDPMIGARVQIDVLGRSVRTTSRLRDI